MKKIIYIATVLLFFSDLMAFQQFDLSFFTSERACKGDTTGQPILQYTDFDIFVTDDNTLFGNKSYICPTTLIGGEAFFEDLADGVPIFVEYNKSNLARLESNAMYRLYQGLIKDFNVSGENDHLYVHHTVTKNSQTYSYIDSFVYFPFGFQSEVFACFPSSNADTTILDKITIKVHFNSGQPKSVAFFGLMGQAEIDVDYIINDVTFDNSRIQNNTIRVNRSDLNSFSANLLVLHTLAGLPSWQNKDYKTFIITNNPSEITKFIVNFDNLSIFFQPFTGFDTELVAGSDSIYHQIIYEQRSDPFCLQIVDLVIDHGSEYRSWGGNLVFGSDQGCLNFKNAAKLRLMEGSQLTYGQDGVGMLGLSGGAVVLEEGSKMIVDAKVLLRNDKEDFSTITLRPGAAIKFTDNVAIDSRSIEGQYIIIYGYAYQVDISEVSESLRSKIVIVEPSQLGSHLGVYPNPVIDYLYMGKDLHGKTYQLYNLSGQLVRQDVVYNNQIGVARLRSGVYVLKVGSEVVRFYKY